MEGQAWPECVSIAIGWADSTSLLRRGILARTTSQMRLTGRRSKRGSGGRFQANTLARFLRVMLEELGQPLPRGQIFLPGRHNCGRVS